jgi:hypothetical protein
MGEFDEKDFHSSFDGFYWVVPNSNIHGYANKYNH